MSFTPGSFQPLLRCAIALLAFTPLRAQVAPAAPAAEVAAAPVQLSVF